MVFTREEQADMCGLGVMWELTDTLGPRLLLSCCSALLSAWLLPLFFFFLTEYKLSRFIYSFKSLHLSSTIHQSLCWIWVYND